MGEKEGRGEIQASEEIMQENYALFACESFLFSSSSAGDFFRS